MTGWHATKCEWRHTVYIASEYSYHTILYVNTYTNTAMTRLFIRQAQKQCRHHIRPRMLCYRSAFHYGCMQVCLHLLEYRTFIAGRSTWDLVAPYVNLRNLLSCQTPYQVPVSFRRPHPLERVYAVYYNRLTFSRPVALHVVAFPCPRNSAFSAIVAYADSH